MIAIFLLSLAFFGATARAADLSIQTTQLNTHLQGTISSTQCPQLKACTITFKATLIGDHSSVSSTDNFAAGAVTKTPSLALPKTGQYQLDVLVETEDTTLSSASKVVNCVVVRFPQTTTDHSEPTPVPVNVLFSVTLSIAVDASVFISSTTIVSLFAVEGPGFNTAGVLLAERPLADGVLDVDLNIWKLDIQARFPSVGTFRLTAQARTATADERLVVLVQGNEEESFVVTGILKATVPPLVRGLTVPVKLALWGYTWGEGLPLVDVSRGRASPAGTRQALTGQLPLHGGTVISWDSIILPVFDDAPLSVPVPFDGEVTLQLGSDMTTVTTVTVSKSGFGAEGFPTMISCPTFGEFEVFVTPDEQLLKFLLGVPDQGLVIVAPSTSKFRTVFNVEGIDSGLIIQHSAFETVTVTAAIFHSSASQPLSNVVVTLHVTEELASLQSDTITVDATSRNTGLLVFEIQPLMRVGRFKLRLFLEDADAAILVLTGQPSISIPSSTTPFDFFEGVPVKFQVHKPDHSTQLAQFRGKFSFTVVEAGKTAEQYITLLEEAPQTQTQTVVVDQVATSIDKTLRLNVAGGTYQVVVRFVDDQNNVAAVYGGNSLLSAPFDVPKPNYLVQLIFSSTPTNIFSPAGIAVGTASDVTVMGSTSTTNPFTIDGHYFSFSVTQDCSVTPPAAFSSGTVVLANNNRATFLASFNSIGQFCIRVGWYNGGISSVWTDSSVIIVKQATLTATTPEFSGTHPSFGLIGGLKVHLEATTSDSFHSPVPFRHLRLRVSCQHDSNPADVCLMSPRSDAFEVPSASASVTDKSFADIVTRVAVAAGAAADGVVATVSLSIYSPDSYLFSTWPVIGTFSVVRDYKFEVMQVDQTNIFKVSVGHISATSDLLKPAISVTVTEQLSPSTVEVLVDSFLYHLGAVSPTSQSVSCRSVGRVKLTVVSNDTAILPLTMEATVMDEIIMDSPLPQIQTTIPFTLRFTTKNGLTGPPVQLSATATLQSDVNYQVHFVVMFVDGVGTATLTVIKAGEYYISWASMSSSFLTVNTAAAAYRFTVTAAKCASPSSPIGFTSAFPAPHNKVSYEPQKFVATLNAAACVGTCGRPLFGSTSCGSFFNLVGASATWLNPDAPPLPASTTGWVPPCTTLGITQIDFRYNDGRDRVAVFKLKHSGPVTGGGVSTLVHGAVNLSATKTGGHSTPLLAGSGSVFVSGAYQVDSNTTPQHAHVSAYSSAGVTSFVMDGVTYTVGQNQQLLPVQVGSSDDCYGIRQHEFRVQAGVDTSVDAASSSSYLSITVVIQETSFYD